MKRNLLLCLIALNTCVAHAFAFDDITFWAGSGSQRAALVVDWNDPLAPPALAWGYRFDGPATGEDMLRAVVTSDPLFFAKVAEFSFGTAVVGLGYDTNKNGMPLSDSTVWPSDRWLVGPPSDGAVALDPVDRYVEGWNTGFWSYWLSQGTTLGSWTESQTGINGRELVDGSWDGLSFAPGFVGIAPDEPVAAPEPSLLASAAVVIVALRQRSTRRTQEQSATVFGRVGSRKRA